MNARESTSQDDLYYNELNLTATHVLYGKNPNGNSLMIQLDIDFKNNATSSSKDLDYISLTCKTQELSIPKEFSGFKCRDGKSSLNGFFLLCQSEDQTRVAVFYFKTSQNPSKYYSQIFQFDVTPDMISKKFDSNSLQLYVRSNNIKSDFEEFVVAYSAYEPKITKGQFLFFSKKFDWKNLPSDKSTITSIDGDIKNIFDLDYFEREELKWDKNTQILTLNGINFFEDSIIFSVLTTQFFDHKNRQVTYGIKSDLKTPSTSNPKFLKSTKIYELSTATGNFANDDFRGQTVILDDEGQIYVIGQQRMYQFFGSFDKDATAFNIVNPTDFDFNQTRIYSLKTGPGSYFVTTLQCRSRREGYNLLDSVIGEGRVNIQNFKLRPKFNGTNSNVTRLREVESMSMTLQIPSYSDENTKRDIYDDVKQVKNYFYSNFTNVQNSCITDLSPKIDATNNRMNLNSSRILGKGQVLPLSNFFTMARFKGTNKIIEATVYPYLDIDPSQMQNSPSNNGSMNIMMTNGVNSTALTISIVDIEKDGIQFTSKMKSPIAVYSKGWKEIEFQEGEISNYQEGIDISGVQDPSLLSQNSTKSKVITSNVVRVQFSKNLGEFTYDTVYPLGVGLYVLYTKISPSDQYRIVECDFDIIKESSIYNCTHYYDPASNKGKETLATQIPPNQTFSMALRIVTDIHIYFIDKSKGMTYDVRVHIKKKEYFQNILNKNKTEDKYNAKGLIKTMLFRSSKYYTIMMTPNEPKMSKFITNNVQTEEQDDLDFGWSQNFTMRGIQNKKIYQIYKPKNNKTLGVQSITPINQLSGSYGVMVYNASFDTFISTPVSYILTPNNTICFIGSEMYFLDQNSHTLKGYYIDESKKANRVMDFSQSAAFKSILNIDLFSFFENFNIGSMKCNSEKGLVQILFRSTEKSQKTLLLNYKSGKWMKDAYTRYHSKVEFGSDVTDFWSDEQDSNFIVTGFSYKGVKKAGDEAEVVITSYKRPMIFAFFDLKDTTRQTQIQVFQKGDDPNKSNSFSIKASVAQDFYLTDFKPAKKLTSNKTSYYKKGDSVPLRSLFVNSGAILDITMKPGYNSSLFEYSSNLELVSSSSNIDLLDVTDFFPQFLVSKFETGLSQGFFAGGTDIYRGLIHKDGKMIHLETFLGASPVQTSWATKIDRKSVSESLPELVIGSRNKTSPIWFPYIDRYNVTNPDTGNIEEKMRYNYTRVKINKPERVQIRLRQTLYEIDNPSQSLMEMIAFSIESKQDNYSEDTMVLKVKSILENKDGEEDKFTYYKNNEIGGYLMTPYTINNPQQETDSESQLPIKLSSHMIVRSQNNKTFYLLILFSNSTKMKIIRVSNLNKESESQTVVEETMIDTNSTSIFEGSSSNGLKNTFKIVSMISCKIETGSNPKSTFTVSDTDNDASYAQEQLDDLISCIVDTDKNYLAKIRFLVYSKMVADDKSSKQTNLYGSDSLDDEKMKQIILVKKYSIDSKIIKIPNTKFKRMVENSEFYAVQYQKLIAFPYGDFKKNKQNNDCFVNTYIYNKTQITKSQMKPSGIIECKKWLNFTNEVFSFAAVAAPMIAVFDDKLLVSKLMRRWTVVDKNGENKYVYNTPTFLHFKIGQESIRLLKDPILSQRAFINTTTATTSIGSILGRGSQKKIRSKMVPSRWNWMDLEVEISGLSEEGSPNKKTVLNLGDAFEGTGQDPNNNPSNGGLLSGTRLLILIVLAILLCLAIGLAVYFIYRWKNRRDSLERYTREVDNEGQSISIGEGAGISMENNQSTEY